MRILWLPQARQDVARLHSFLVGKSRKAGSRAARLILKGANRLAEQPLLGRPMDDDTQRREFVIPAGGSAYVLRYRIDGDAVVVIRVWHSRENRL